MMPDPCICGYGRAAHTLTPCTCGTATTCRCAMLASLQGQAQQLAQQNPQQNQQPFSRRKPFGLESGMALRDENGLPLGLDAGAGTRVLYLAHPVSGDVAANLARAKRWLRWAQRAFPACAVIAPWIQAIEVVGDDDSNAAERERGLQRDEAIAARCDAVLWVGGRVSSGMAREGKVARAVVDLTALGDEPPEAA